MKFIASSVVLSALCATLAFGAKWDENNDPSVWSPSFEYNLNKLALSAKLQRDPWSDTYWPSFQGGIANRWQDSQNDYPGFNFKLYTLDELKNGSVNLNILSPAEKFDIYNSRYDYPLLNSEWKRTSPNDATWEGICHGWAPAAIHYEQPNAVTMTNKEGLEIPFASSDVKALLSYFLAQFAQGQEKPSFIANRCNSDIQKNPRKANDPECWDINPGSFHIMLTNLIGAAGTGFVADIDRSIEVWNQPIARYEYTLGNATKPSNQSAPGSVSEQPVTLTMYYTKETRASPQAHDALILNKQYKYSLELDAQGNILGGSYNQAQWDRVDFMWAEEAPEFFGYFKDLETIFKAATANTSRLFRTAQKPRPRRQLVDYRPSIVNTGAIRLASYDAETRRSWLVPAGDNATPLRLRFQSFNTRRNTDFVRVYEIENGAIGAPVAVLHGESQPDDIVLRPGVSALITFSVDQRAARRMSMYMGTGFELFVDN